MVEPIWTFGEMFKAQRRRIAELEAAHERLCAEIVRLTGELGATRRRVYARCAERVQDLIFWHENVHPEDHNTRAWLAQVKFNIEAEAEKGG